MSRLEVQGISKKIKKRIIIDLVSFSVESGQVVGLLGPNGAGKTTSFYVVVGLLLPDCGQVWLDEQEISQVPMFKRAQMGLSYLPQEASIFRGLTVSENILVALEAKGYGAVEKNRHLERLLEEFNLGSLKDHYGYVLSGGERRRVEITRALASQPKFLFLDEPFAGVDPIVTESLKEVIRNLRDRGIGILITDHNVREILGICDKVYILNEGKVQVHGTAEEVVTDPIAMKFYLGENFRL